MTKEWDEERVRLLGDVELHNLMENAQKRGSEPVAELCALEIERRRSAIGVRNARVRKVSGPHGSSGLRKIDADTDELLVRLANDLMTTYDLSEETAQKLSANRIRPLSMLSKNGKMSKIGGFKKRGEVAIFRYISYRIGDATISLAAVMAREGEDQVTWRVDGPDHLVPAKEERYLGTKTSRGVWFNNFEDTAEKFRDLIALLAPKAPKNMSTDALG